MGDVSREHISVFSIDALVAMAAGPIIFVGSYSFKGDLDSANSRATSMPSSDIVPLPLRGPFVTSSFIPFGPLSAPHTESSADLAIAVFTIALDDTLPKNTAALLNCVGMR